MIKGLISFALLALIITGCRQQKELIYFPGLGESTIENPTSQEAKNYRIRVNDLLYIRVLSLSEQINAIFNEATGNSGQNSYMQYQEAGMYYSGFAVNNNGVVELPEIGNIEVVGLTIEEAKAAIHERVNHYYTDANVIVKLANLKFTILGEVKAPGTYINYNNQTTILEALGMAGDLTDYGNRKEVLIIRPTIDGVSSHRVNLNNKNLLSSPFYYLKPNDVVYVQPLKAKGTRMISQDYGVFVSIISSTLATASVVLTLILNLKK